MNQERAARSRYCNISLPDAYIEHGNVELLKQEIGLDAESITGKILEDS